MIETNEVRQDEIGLAQEAAKGPDLTAERAARCLPVAQQIQAILGKAEVVIDPKSKDAFDKYVPLYQEIALVLIENKVKLSEVGYCFALARQCAIMLEDIATQSLNKHIDTVYEKYWGKPNSEVTVAELDEKVK